jgi:hypothetical protein
MMIVTVMVKLYRKVLIRTIIIMPHPARSFRNDGLTPQSDIPESRMLTADHSKEVAKWCSHSSDYRHGDQSMMNSAICQQQHHIFCHGPSSQFLYLIGELETVHFRY